MLLWSLLVVAYRRPSRDRQFVDVFLVGRETGARGNCCGSPARRINLDNRATDLNEAKLGQTVRHDARVYYCKGRFKFQTLQVLFFIFEWHQEEE